VREEKLMLMAVNAGDLASTTECLRQIISNCVVGDFDVDNMSMIDMETLFLHLRAHSIGEKGITHFKCKNLVPKKQTDTNAAPVMVECGMVLDVPVDFLNVPVLNRETSLSIRFTDHIGVKMRFPTFNLFRTLQNIPETEVELAIAANCLDVIYDKDTAHRASDCTEQELRDFLLALPGDKYERIREFIQNTPQSHQETDIKCVKCGYEHKIVLEGIQDFFV
jgi:hypothetical protein